MSTHSFHLREPIEARFSTGDDYACAIFSLEDSSIELFAYGDDMRERLKRATEAFAVEMHREPVAQQIAEAAE